MTALSRPRRLLGQDQESEYNIAVATESSLNTLFDAVHLQFLLPLVHLFHVRSVLGFFGVRRRFEAQPPRLSRHSCAPHLRPKEFLTKSRDSEPHSTTQEERNPNERKPTSKQRTREGRSEHN